MMSSINLSAESIAPDMAIHATRSRTCSTWAQPRARSINALRIITAILTVVATLEWTGGAMASTWVPAGAGLWNDSGNWSSPVAVPTSADSVTIGVNGAHATLSGAAGDASSLSMSPPSTTAALTIDGTSLDLHGGGMTLINNATATTVTLTLTNGATMDNVGAGTFVRRNGTLNIVLEDASTLNGSGNFILGNFENNGPKSVNLTLSDGSVLNRTTGNIIVGSSISDNRTWATFTLNDTSQINLNAGSISLSGARPVANGGAAGGFAVYDLPMAAATGTNGKIFASNGVSSVAATPSSLVQLNLDSTVGVTLDKRSDPILNWNGGSLNIGLLSTTGSGTGIVSLNGMTLNNVGASTWGRRGGHATLNMTNSTINGSGTLTLGANGEGAELITLNLTNSIINRTTGGISMGGNHNNERVIIAPLGTSQINLAAGGFVLAGGNTGQAAVGDTPAGTMIYNLPLTNNPLGSPGKIYAHTGVNSIGEQSVAKTELNITSSGSFASDSTLNWHGGGLSIAAGGAGGLGRVIIDGVSISNVAAFTIARRTNSNGTLSIKDATFGTSGITIGFGEGTGERARLLLDNATVNSTGQITNRNQANASTEVRGTGAINVTAGAFRNDGRVVADGGLLTIVASSGITSGNLATSQSFFGQSGWYATDGSGVSKLTLPGLTSVGAGKTWGEDPADTSPDLINSVRFYNVSGLTGTLNGSLLAVDHTSIPAGLVNPIGVWEFSTDGPFTSGEVTIRYDELATNLGAIAGGEADLKLFHYEGGMWVDITDGLVDTVNNRIDSIAFTSFSPFAVAEDAINASAIPEPSTYALALLGLAGLVLAVWRRGADSKEKGDR